MQLNSGVYKIVNIQNGDFYIGSSINLSLREKNHFNKLKHGKHPIMNMCCANAKVVGDSGARKFDKKTARGRIDGMVALAMAVGVMPIDATDGNIYDTRGVVFV